MVGKRVPYKQHYWPLRARILLENSVGYKNWGRRRRKGEAGREKQEGRRRSRRRPEGEEFFFWGSYDSFVVSEVITDDEYQVVNY